MKRLSILIPVYRVDLYLPELLTVLLPQVTAEAELIFYDDASPDESVAIIQQAQMQWPQVAMRIVHGEHNIGLTGARRQLLSASQADYVWFIDSDDRIDSTAVGQILAVLNQYEPDVLLFDYDVFFDGSNQLKRCESLKMMPVNKLAANEGHLYRMAILDGKHYFWNKVFCRQRIMDVVSFEIPAFEDMAYTPILLNQCQSYYYLSQTLLHYRIRQDSIAQKMSVQQIYGVQAYSEQADYAARQVGDHKSEAYLLYKVCIYYLRIRQRIHQDATLSIAEKDQLLGQLNTLYLRKKRSEWQIVWLLCQHGMLDKAIKLIIKNWFVSTKK